MKRDRAILDRAHRHRAGIIGILEACQLGSRGHVTCAYPVVLADTSTGHELDCPAHGMQLSQRAVADRRDPQPTTTEEPT